MIQSYCSHFTFCINKLYWHFLLRVKIQCCMWLSQFYSQLLLCFSDIPFGLWSLIFSYEIWLPSVLQLRHVMDPKRHFKRSGKSKALPKYFQVSSLINHHIGKFWFCPLYHGMICIHFCIWFIEWADYWIFFFFLLLALGWYDYWACIRVLLK